MFTHNLKIAFRNMRKYFNQTLISVIGLAVGFTCFALSMLWIRYEMTFDSFLKNAENMYVVYTPRSTSPTGYDRLTPFPLAAYLKETFPEISNAASVWSFRIRTTTVEDIEFPAITIVADSSFLQIFDVNILEGNRDFMISGNRSIAITLDKARQMFGNENPIGKTIGINYFGYQDFTISAIVTEISPKSNYTFDIIAPIRNSSVLQDWRSSSENVIIELLPGTNIEAFEKKLYSHHTGEGRGNISKMMIKPITKIRYTDPNIAR